MLKNFKKHMLDRPYIKDVIKELQDKGLEEEAAKINLIKYYRPIKRTLGFEPNAGDFADAIVYMDKAMKRIHNPNDPNQIYIGHLKNQITHKTNEPLT